MKKSILFCLILSFLSGIAQEFKSVFESKMPFSADLGWSFDDEAKEIIWRSDDEIAYVDGNTGKPVWTKKVKEILGEKKADFARSNHQMGLLALVMEGSESKGGKIAVVEMKSGNTVYQLTDYPIVMSGVFLNDFKNADRQTPYVSAYNTKTKKIDMLDIKTGKVLWAVNYTFKKYKESGVYINDDKVLVALEEVSKSNYELAYFDLKTGTKVDTYKRKFRKNQGLQVFNFSNTEKIAITYETGLNMLDGNDIVLEFNSANGSWQKEFVIKMVFGVATSKPIFYVINKEKYIAIVSNEIVVIDKATKNEVYRNQFQIFDIEGLAKQRTYICDKPIIEGDILYYADLKGSLSFKKVDLTSKKVIWENKLFSKKDIAPVILKYNETILIQTAGNINIQSTVTVNNLTFYKSFNNFTGEPNLIALNATNGQKIWDAEQFGKEFKDKLNDRLSNVYIFNNEAFITSSKNIYRFDVNSGKVIKHLVLKELKAGYPLMMMYAQKEKTHVLLTQNGVIGMSDNLDQVKFNVKLTEVADIQKQGETYVIVNKYNKNYDVEEFSVVDFENGKIYGRLKCDYLPDFTEKGDYFIVRDGKNLKKFSVF
jgi:outer membrane protein assembly factor BamB